VRGFDTRRDTNARKEWTGDTKNLSRNEGRKRNLKKQDSLAEGWSGNAKGAVIMFLAVGVVMRR